MCTSCQWEAAIRLSETVIGLAEEISEQFFHDNADAMEFAESVKSKTESISDWVETNKHVTQNQLGALQNMKDGAERWLR